VVQQVISPEGQVLYQPQPSARTVKLSPKVWNTIHQAMEDVVTTGTGHGVFRPDLVMGAKTGTAQNPHGKDHSWFGAYAGLPGQRPSLVVVVFVEHGGHGSAAAGPVARMAINTAFPPAAAGQKGHQATSPGLPLPSPAIPVVPSGSRP
jgi:cell division protein FtsI/penicillin-binding protein 2